MVQVQDDMNTLLTAEVKATHLLETEYKQLTKAVHLNGVLVLPHLDSVRVWDGVLFLREGIYAGGIFKFRMNFPQTYPSDLPSLVFQSDVFHPLVDPQTGDLDLREFVGSVPKSKQMSINILKYMKNIFLMNSHLKIETSANPTAGKMFNGDYQEFVAKAEESVNKSMEE